MPLTEAQRRKKMWDINRARGLSQPRRATEQQEADARAHVDRLRKSGASITLIAEAAGLALSSVHQVTQNRPLARTTCEKVMAVRHEHLAHALSMTAAELLWHVRTLQAVGYTVTWQESAGGFTRHSLRLAVGRAGRGRLHRVEPDTAAKVRALHGKYATTQATSHVTGCTPGIIERAKREAREHGYYPAAAYDEDGAVDFRAVPGHPIAKTDEWAHRRIDALRLILAHDDEAEAALSRHLGLDDEAERVAEEQFLSRILDRLHLRQSQPWSVFARAMLSDALQHFDDGDGDPVLFCLDNHLAKWNSSAIARQHPGLLEWMKGQEKRSRPGREFIATMRKIKAAEQVAA